MTIQGLFENFPTDYLKKYEKYKKNLKHVFQDFEGERKQHY